MRGLNICGLLCSGLWSCERRSSQRISRFSRDSRGSTSVGYALVTVAVIAVVLGSVAMLGSAVHGVFSGVPTGFTVPSAGDVDGGSRHADGLASQQIGESDQAGSRLFRVLAVCCIALGAAVSGVVGWVMLQPSNKKKPKQPEQPEQKEPVEEKILLTRLNKKRELLWRQLLSDNDLVLKNCIEVRHVMTDDPVTVNPGTSGKQIGELLTRHHVGHLVVCDKEKRFVGVINAAAHRANPGGRAEEIMAPPSLSVTPKTSLGAAISMLVEQGASFLPVVDKEQLDGVLAPIDLVLTLHCSLQLWLRVAQTMDANAERAEVMEATSRSINETAGKLGQRVQRLPQEVKTAIKTGNAAALEAELSQTMASVARLMQQLEEARKQIKEQTEQIADLKEPSPDSATGAASREEMDKVLGRLLPGDGGARQSVSLILYVADGYHKLLREEGQEAADAHLRLAVQRIAEEIDSGDHLSRYSDNTLAIVLPGRPVDDACKLGSRLSAAWSAVGDGAQMKPKMSIVSARRGESVPDFLKRAEAALKQTAEEREASVVAGA